MKAKLGCALILSILMIIGIGCAQKPVTESGSNEPSSVQGQGQSPSPAETTVEPETRTSQSVEVYYADAELLELEQQEQTIDFKEETEKYQKTFEALQNSSDANLLSLWNQVELLSATFEDGALTLDVHIPEEANLGSSGELLALDALTQTMFQFDEVNSIDVLVDGEASESLMGHSELEHPIQRAP
ncbi:GerMN domain-containing protein [Paenibacillus sp. ACRSA]|uniref:GerMN domain-containing protein n=1 Tax=Paenibacillus sp. ACRSA TaxID=2918211 RepID=UPI001EF44211|nr:GerMN domain-containing protein [Paenibacillus sp. ACRSA]MCG7379175.1 GerMN domain-containing protein [Paenibacillus sp. ACRSA]